MDSSSNSISFQVIELLQNIMTVVCAGGWKQTAFSQANSTNRCTVRRASSGWIRPKAWRMCFDATTRSSWVTGWVPPQLSLFGTKPLTLPTIGLSICDGEHRSNLILPHKEEFKLAVLISFSDWSFSCICCLLDSGFLCICYLYSIVGSSTDWTWNKRVEQKIMCTLNAFEKYIYMYVILQCAEREDWKATM